MSPEQKHMGMDKQKVTRKCTANGCDRKHYAKGYCTKHYQRLLSTGSVDDLKKLVGCQVDGCDGEIRGNGLCSKHYYRMRRHGILETKIIIGNNKKRLINNVVITAEGCWEWIKCKKLGYGVTSLNRKSEQAHRASWKVFVGDIADGQQINHKCHNRLCINPDHLYQGTQVENMRDMEVSGRANRANRAIGEKSGKAVLSSESVKEIKKLIREGFNNVVLSEKFLVAPTTISSIRNNKTWRHI